MQIEHEVDERSRQACAGAAQDREPRTGNPCSAFEVQDAKGRSQIPMRLRVEVETAGLADPAHFLVVGGTRADRDAGVRKVGQLQQRFAPLMLDRVDLEPKLLDLLRAQPVRFLNGGSVLSLPLGLCDLVS
jgi:hypothetical protein